MQAALQSGESFLVLFFKKEPLAYDKRKQALLFEKRSKNFFISF
jgi:hypothetical protein